MPVRLWRCVCVRGVGHVWKECWVENHRIIQSFGVEQTFNAHQVQSHCMGRCVLAMTPAMHLRELSESSSGQMSGQGLVSQYWTQCPSSPAALLQHQVALFWGGEGVMETPIPLVLEEVLSWSPFANDWDYPNLNVAHSIWCKSFSRKITEFNSAWPNFTSCGAFIYQRQRQYRRNLPWNSKVLKCSACQLLSTSVKGSRLSGSADLMDLCSSLKIFPTHVTAYPVQIFLQAF